MTRYVSRVVRDWQWQQAQRQAAQAAQQKQQGSKARSTGLTGLQRGRLRVAAGGGGLEIVPAAAAA